MVATNAETKHDLWVFGYGSLLWMPGFRYEDKVTGYVQGYKRRFWLLNTTHRGVPEQPGRVVTLVKDPEQIVWGVAYKIPKEDVKDVKKRLAVREQDYATQVQRFHPRNGNRESFSVMLYIGSQDHPNFGPASDFDVALNIRRSKGPSGNNSEYLFKLAEFVRKYIPEDKDNHLFKVERLVKCACSA